MIVINLYDEVELMDGTEGSVVDRYGNEDRGDDDLFIVDIGDSPSTWATIDVRRKDIKRVIKNNSMTEEAYKYILARLLERAFESIEEAKQNNSDFDNGRKLAYYEIADIIKSELDVRDADLKEFGLDVDLKKTFL